MKNTNRLINEKSPYLLQHAHNPVDWFPWSDEAFEKAIEENKPIFLSIGYSTCHWCHVMEHESFEDNEVAKLMNENFISIKVDREERPDIDSIYMSVCQMMTGGGGWPLTIVMTPEKKPFFSGTYFPKESRNRRIGMIDLIKNISDAWINKKEQIDNSANSITSHLISTANKSHDSKFDINSIQDAYKTFSGRFESEYGGFGDSPKFPSPHNLIFLIRYGHLTSDTDAIQMVEKTLKGMRKGGIFDHVGFGFHRYSTDNKWLLPHFEKMLYDQAMLILCFTEAYQKTRDQFYKNTAEEIIEYVLRDMVSPQGGFYSAEDADSEGVEGKFYVWSEAELKDILGEDFDLAKSIYNTVEGGNFIEESTRNFTGENILHQTQSDEEIAQRFDLSEADLKERIASIRQRLFDRRVERIHPLKDTKILTDWNGLMIAALSFAGRVFNNEDFIEAAERSFNFITNYLKIDSDKLLHRFKDGESKIPGMLDDYAFVIWGCLELFESTFNTKYLKLANELSITLVNDFGDVGNGAFFISSKDTDDVPARTKEIYDGAIPSGNSVAAMNFLKLSRILGKPEFEVISEKISDYFSESIKKYPAGYTHLLASKLFTQYGSKELILVGDNHTINFNEIITTIREKYIPNKIVINLNKENIDELSGLAEYLANYPLEDKNTKLYICEDYKCNAPLENLEAIQKEIKKLF
ncbi:MAG: thioredoxin domain-containing protein [Melioribacteraceae bacterium]|nr:thioredoxin domain-containing protein [Melioribacteraceae bacterium]MCF8263834.1 thioredoxin domain-containing protein [Melioribacteraceae bacterium]MCF8412515.1 thioredoxin domain-containing protein [Melioribacteraceae bacterium]MCF8432180.1 thioredoxin domain-containing protein [Melioribacteraceae bacterium]